jgi:hypothetical protein
MTKFQFALAVLTGVQTSLFTWLFGPEIAILVYAVTAVTAFAGTALMGAGFRTSRRGPDRQGSRAPTN